MMPIRERYPLLIGGQRVETDEWHSVEDPLGGPNLCQVAAAGIDETDAAVRAAEAAGVEWALCTGAR
jgi:acyl-CoA reductase-like NAD-dependent aldehyde dehydrogenase